MQWYAHMFYAFLGIVFLLGLVGLAIRAFFRRNRQDGRLPQCSHGKVFWKSCHACAEDFARKEELQGSETLITIKTVIKEFSKGLEKVVDLQKLKPDAQVPISVSVPQYSTTVERIVPPDGVLGTHPDFLTLDEIGRLYGEGTYKITRREANKPVAVFTYKLDSNYGPPQGAPGQLKALLPQDLMKEWALHVESGSDATTFANIFLEMMRDPKNDESRRTCVLFAAYMKPRNWQKMFPALRPNLDAETLRAFQLPQAQEFYESFRAMITYQIQDYWEQFMKEKREEGEDDPSPVCS